MNDETGDHLTGVSTRLLVLLIAMVVAGFVLPSPNAGADDGYHDLPGKAAPERLIVPSIDLRAPIVPIEVDQDGVLTPPYDHNTVGWWMRSAKPGATVGQTVVTGHTVHTGGGVMNRLGDLKPGDLVRIRTAKGTVDYSTTKVVVYSKEKLAKHADELFSQDHEPVRLVLITCTDWRNGVYYSNIVVFADPLGVRDKPAQKAAPTKAGAAS